MKIRFYHMWVYRFFYWVWTPILESRPDIVIAMRDWNQQWLDRREYEINARRSNFHIVKKMMTTNNSNIENNHA